jgi:hypothetical protein
MRKSSKFIYFDVFAIGDRLISQIFPDLNLTAIQIFQAGII